MRRQHPKWKTSLLPLLNGEESGVATTAGLAERIVASGLVPASVTTSKVIDFFLAEGALRLVELQPKQESRRTDEPYKPIKRLTWGDPSLYRIALSLRPRSYFSHGCAAYLNGLIQVEQIQWYLNQEQSPKPAPSGLDQAAIDRAFRSAPRSSNLVYIFGRYEFVLLSGKNTGNLEVARLAGPDTDLPVTSVERTLIDLAVRPHYAGGVAEVLRIFEAARPRADTVKLGRVLDQLAYAYPYHQAVGFYMERAGYGHEQMAPFDERDKGFDFYLANAMKKMSYSSRWRIQYPAELDD